MAGELFWCRMCCLIQQRGFMLQEQLLRGVIDTTCADAADTERVALADHRTF